jgi:hypothetical protein
MSLKNGKHIVEEIYGVRCSIVEKGITEERLNFLKVLLEYNGYKVAVREEFPTEESQGTTNSLLFTIGVTDLLFNPIVDVYKRRLHTKTGHKVTPAYWLQLSTNETEAEVNYWNFKPQGK